MKGRIRSASWLMLAFWLVAGSADAEIYKCVGPDGKTFFTSDRTACKGAQPHVLKKKVQNVLDDRSSPVRRNGGPPARPAPRAASPGDGLESMWRRKRPAAEEELRQLGQQLQNMNSVIRSCNRGGEWYQTEESGIRKHIPCEELRERQAKLGQRQADLTEYLKNGLEDECRRAGCQPGWVR